MPAETWMFWARSAARTSFAFRLCAATLSGSSQMRIAYSRPAKICTSPTPGSRVSASFTCSEDLVCVQIMRGDLVRIEPDAHRIFAAGEDLHVANAWQPRQRVLHVQRGVIRDVEQVTRAIGRIEVNGEQNIGRRLSHLNALPL